MTPLEAGRTRVTQLAISNFRSIGRDVTIRFAPLTVLVGPNGSGKSNLVDALRFFADCMSLGLGGAINDRNGIETCRRWNRSSGGSPYNVSLKVELELPEGHASYAIVLHGSAIEEYGVKSEEAWVRSKGDTHELKVHEGVVRVAPAGLSPDIDKQTLALPLVGGDIRFRPLFSALKNFAVYSIYPNTLRQPVKYSPSRPMLRHGENWASILQDQPGWKAQLVAALNKLTGDIDDIRIHRTGGHLVVQFRREIKKQRSSAQKWFDVEQESDGTLRVAGIITALLQEPPIPIVGIEEPELTIHPGAIGLLFDHLRQASLRSQVIVTTHSPDLLDLIRDEEAIRVVSRDGAHGTSVTPLALSQREAVRAGLMTLGEMLRSEGFQPELPHIAPPDED